MNKILPILIFLLALKFNVPAQQYYDDGSMRSSEQRFEYQTHKSKQNQSAQTSANNLARTQFETLFDTVEWKYPAYNFMPSGIGEYAGDINGDGIDDLIRSYNWVFDLTGAAGSSGITKRSLVFFGGESRNLFPDQYVNSKLTPAGDVNADGFADATGLNEDGSYTLFLGSEEGYINGGDLPAAGDFFRSVSFKDFNGDGYDDLLFFKKVRKIGYSYNVFFGGENQFGINPKEYATFDESEEITVVKHGDKHLVYEFKVDRTSEELQYTAYEFSPANNVIAIVYSGSYDISDYKLRSVYFQTQAISANDDNFEDILIHFRGGSPGSVANLLLFNSEEGLSPELYKPRSTVEWVSVGDINADGLTDFIFNHSDTTLAIGIASYETEYSITYGDEQIIRSPNRDYVSIYSGFYFGDINGDGYDDFQIPISNREGSGNRTYYGSQLAVIERADDVIYPRADFQKNPEFKSSLTLKDFNGDGINDLAMLYDNRVDVHYGGGKITTTPDLTIGFGDQPFHLSEFEAGDFNGDQLTDIAVAVSVDIGERSSQKEVQFFYGSKNPDAEIDHTIISPISDITYYFQLSISNAGDYNGDGIDDLMVSTVGIPKILVYLGGNNMSNSMPDQTMIVPVPYGYKLNSIPLFSYFMKGVGDINGDGIDDVVLSNLDRSLTNATLTKTAWDAGELYVFYGYKEVRETRRPARIIKLNNLSFSNYIKEFGWSLAAADIDADGVNDLIIMPKRFAKSEDSTEGIDAVFIYQAGWRAFKSYDNSFPLYSDPFGGNGEPFTEFFGNLITVPDLDGDGSDELLLTSSLKNQNAALYMGGRLFDFSADAILESPNPAFSLGVEKRYQNVQNRTAIGDFNNDGKLEVILPQIEDDNFQNTPVYIFPLEAPEKKTQRILIDAIPRQESIVEIFRLEAKATSNLAVEYELLEGPAKLEESTLFFTGKGGTVVVRVSQPGNEDYFPASSVEITFEIEESVITSVSEETDAGIMSYPNPTQGLISIRSGQFAAGQTFSVQVLTMSGQVINQSADYHKNNDMITIDLSDLKSGFYLVNVISESGNSLVRVIKQ